MVATVGLVAMVGALVGAQLVLLIRPAWAGLAADRVDDEARFVRRPPRVGPSRRVFLAAIVVGGLLRLLWVIWATRTPAPLTDPSEYLRIASEFTHGLMPRFGGVGGPSAYWSPGYPAVLSPFVWVAERSGWLSPAFAAALVNVVAGTVTIWLSGLLAGRWIDPRARNAAAWLVALCPALIYYTATAHTETAFTPMLLATIVLAGSRTTDVPVRNWVLAGLFVGAAFLVRAPAVIGLFAPVFAIRTRGGSWMGAARATGLVVLGAAVFLVPWTIRNGVQVGIWSPGSTSNAAAVCFGHNDGVVAKWETSLADPRLQVACFRRSPYDDPRLLPVYGGEVPEGFTLGGPDEVRWYRETMADGVHWALTHPTDEVQLSVDKVWETWSDEGRVVDAARNYERRRWAGQWNAPLGALANLWLWIVGALALAGLALVPRCRRALPIWAPVLLFTVAIVGGVSQPHYRFPVVPLVAVLAAGMVCRRSLEETV